MRAYVVNVLAILAAATPALAGDPQIIGEKNGKDVVTVRVPDASTSKQSLPFFPGVSNKNAGAKNLSLLKVVIPPGASAQAHVHKGYESAIYLLQGSVETKYGEHLEKSVVNVAGDFIYIPADVPHQPTNLSKTEPAIAIVARNDGDEQEHVILLPKK
ncbi:cupin domain-containing protein [Methylocystis parvus]|uniref:Cupin domain-containing protein n=1 Tax=Methylocystis parvus TaxID=134 RepID=A0A6B8M562_9HYPH|nr:cupin domain-containing protein [Methylocystis parvus]QGM99114.1 cupin domain-containing protein [Methylocystis parvus]WBK00516.1 cupin domain-containing protein [Methylocystis parvus OBBP]